MSKMNKLTELKALFDKLEEVGFEINSSTVYNVFKGEEVPEHTELDWNESGELFDKVIADFEVKVITGEFGHEGAGEYCYSILKVKDNFFRASWSYYSYQGCEYDYIENTLEEVKPVEKTITVYESV